MPEQSRPGDEERRGVPNHLFLTLFDTLRVTVGLAATADRTLLNQHGVTPRHFMLKQNIRWGCGVYAAMIAISCA